ncbi:MAG TPA: histone deacetylase family protein, partial [Anaerolineae bacterium]|nr:histone deacetylase family protein [Anaerolineae bacterium]
MHIIASRRHRAHNTTYILPGYASHYDEVPQRAEAILAAVSAAGLGEISEPMDHGLAPILAVHDADLVEFLQGAYQGSRAFLSGEAPLFPDGYFAVRGWRHRPNTWQQQSGYYAIDRDCPILAGTWDAAYWSAQAALTAANLVQAGERTAYALCRPPGHHASASQYGGYCYLNNAAIAVRHLQSCGRVAMVDIDYHHGNGTQEIFYADPTVLTCSLHADPDEEYPYFWGAAAELGSGPGLGANRNWPLPAGTDDDAYLAALDEALDVVAAFQANYLLISAGFDLLAGDSVATTGGFLITPEGLELIGRRLAGLGL